MNIFVTNIKLQIKKSLMKAHKTKNSKTNRNKRRKI